MVAWGLCFLPYHALGWDAFIRQAWNVPLSGPAESFPQVWLGEAVGQGLTAVPHEKLYLAALGIFLLGLVHALRRPLEGSAAFWSMLVGLLLLTTWMHLGTRSPYTYLSLVEAPPHWYANQLFAEPGQGLVEGDYRFFEATEQIFRGQKISPEGTVFLRRPLMVFLSSQLSAFFHPLYVYLALNVGAWLLACLLLHRYATELWGGKVAAYATLLMACAPGFITYVSQPMVYGGALASIAISLGLFHLAFAPAKAGWERYAFFGAVLGLMLLTYDLFPQLLVFAALAWSRRLPWRLFAGAVVLSLLIYAGFNLLVLAMQLPMSAGNTGFLTGTLTQIGKLLSEGRVLALLGGVLAGLLIFLRSVLYSHFYVVPLLALIGLALAPRGRAREEALWLCLSAALTVLALHLGGQRWFFAGFSELPRFAFVAYPGVFLLAALALSRLEARRGPWASGALVGALFLLTNLDAFGGPLTLLYYHYQWP